MSSYYRSIEHAPEVHDADSDVGLEVPCKPCHQTGLVWVQGQETDCIDCEGMGSVIV